MPLFVITNPVCGDKLTPSFFEKHVFPRLDAHNITVDHVLQTNSPDHAQSFLREYITTNSDFADDNGITVILGSGDGTMHEIIESILPYTLQHEQLRINFVLIPCGTANALYYSLFPDSIENPDMQCQKQTNDDVNPSKKLRSLEAFLSGKGLKTISLAVTTIVAQNATEAGINTAAVVTSTAFHACILRDSESLRDKYPGVERFKVAAQKNGTLWYHARVKLYPVQSTGKVEKYDPESHSFTTLESPHGSTSVDLEGPFVYFTATTNVDRLEPTFRILPLMRSLPPSSPSCDIAIVRPLRCSAIARDDEDSRAAFGARTWKVLHGAYEDGSHVRHRYDANGDITVEGHGPTVVEYVRCGGWEWVPMEGDPNAHVLCCDGGIVSIKPGGTAACVVDTKGRFRVYV